jgi:hypothetical protein
VAQVVIVRVIAYGVVATTPYGTRHLLYYSMIVLKKCLFFSDEVANLPPAVDAIV